MKIMFLLFNKFFSFQGTCNENMIRLVLILYQVSVISSQIPKYTYNTEDSTVQNIIYDDSNKRVFVGGTNQILRLSVCSTFTVML